MIQLSLAHQSSVCLLNGHLGKPGAFSRFYPKTYINSDNEEITVDDSKNGRLDMFKKAMTKLDEYSFEHVAMPYIIGCGLAGRT